jgi:molybdenum ABC transporter molybdate-binding protein
VRRAIVPVLVVTLASAPAAWAQEAVRVHAAGSLRASLTAVADRFTALHAIPVRFEFGASGLLRERLEKGEPSDVFASANMEHPRALEQAGKAGPVRLFARNELCALAGASVKATTDTLLDVMLDPATRVGTSTPKADPSGDYAFEVFRKAEAIRPGSRARLEQKALQLTGGGPNDVRAPAGTSVYAFAIEQRLADVFLTYCTNARSALRQMRGGSVVTLAPALSVGAEYGLTLLTGARPAAARFVEFILSADGQEILARRGFTPAGGPAPAEPRAVPELKSAPATHRVTAIGYCRGVYEVKLADGSVRTFGEYDLSFKTDTSANGPDAGRPALIPTGRLGNRAIVVFATLDELRGAFRQSCPRS